MDFQNQKNVSVLDYLKMIEYKTAYLIASSLSIGGLTARTTKKNINPIIIFLRYNQN